MSRGVCRMSLWFYMRGSKMLDIKVGYRCNNRCIHCVVDPVRLALLKNDAGIDRSTRDITKHIDLAARIGAEAVVLTGGEITLRDDFEQLVTHAVKNGLEVCIQTNGRVLSDCERCRFLADLERVSLVVALHASDPETHDRITQERGSFAETTKAIRNLRLFGVETALKMVLSRLNASEIVKTAEFAEELDVSELCIAFPHALDLTEDARRRIVPRYAQLREQLDTVSRRSEAGFLPITFETFPFCILPTSPPFWVRNCDLHSSLRGLELASEPLLEREHMWDWERLRPALKHKSEACAQCVFDHICEGPWSEYVDTYGSAEFVAVCESQVREFVMSVA